MIGGGYPSQVWMVGGLPWAGLDGGGYPSQVWMVGGGVPQPGLDGGGVPQPHLDGGGVYPGYPPGQVWMELGYPGYPPLARSEWWGYPPTMTGWGIPPP